MQPADLADEAFVDPEQEAGAREVARRGGFAPRIISAPGGLVAVLTQVSFGMGVSVAPDVLAGVIQVPGAVFRPLAGEAIVSEVAVIYRALEASPPVKRFIEQIEGPGC